VNGLSPIRLQLASKFRLVLINPDGSPMAFLNMPFSLALRDGKILGASCDDARLFRPSPECAFTPGTTTSISISIPDESGKVKQVLKNKRNFNHPLMLLDGEQMDPQAGWNEA